MKTLLCSLLLVSSLSAQVQLRATISPSTLKPGQSATVTLALSGTPMIAGLQWTLGLPLGLVGVQALNPAVAAVPKQLTCGVACLVFGFNVLDIPVGPIVTVPITIPANAAAGTQTIALTNVVGSSGAGINIPVQAIGGTITILDKFDVNGDGVVSAPDVTAMVTQVASGTCTADVIGNGSCNVIQVIVEVIAWAANGSKP